MRTPKADEVEAVNAFSEEHFDYTFNPNYMGVIDHYSSDGPGWTGKVLVVFGGEVEIINIFCFEGEYIRYHAMEEVAFTTITFGDLA
jgi:hypothetical protein